MSNCLYEIPVKVKPKDKDSMPAGYVAAIVNCYVAAVDYTVALRNTVKKLSKDCYIFVGLASEIRQIDPGKWESFVELGWSDLSDYLPSAKDIANMIETGGVMYGPFIGYESED